MEFYKLIRLIVIQMGKLLAKAVFKRGKEELSPVNRSLEEIQLKSIDGELITMGDIMSEKSVLMVVNVATK